ncbi:MAG: hypothetical protein AVDCRST_MAG96-1757 [uncultured Segetibacter sp.]|uniref:Uncharacterized protein n=1 Tax=uncultured Segetibacter sp. TaxID=481133 RepID=A0A6J4SMG2_9BACT|nr:MAG: hypothetical protein AVDCRST_MAG96-1757 [uncultured Segetibacter sp.]
MSCTDIGPRISKTKSDIYDGKTTENNAKGTVLALSKSSQRH